MSNPKKKIEPPAFCKRCKLEYDSSDHTYDPSYMGTYCNCGLTVFTSSGECLEYSLEMGDIHIYWKEGKNNECNIYYSTTNDRQAIKLKQPLPFEVSKEKIITIINFS